MLAIEKQRAAERSAVMAAVDLGSNSFHMVVAHMHHGQLAIIDRLKEMVRLAAGLKDDGTLDAVSQERALECLGRFGQRLRDMHADHVRVVGTNTLRKASAPEVFLARAEEALGHPVDVISGLEEARLIYSGVAHHSQGGSGQRFVMDIGGGSTELIIGAGLDPQYLESLALGCVGTTQRFFPDNRYTAKAFDKARLSVRLRVSPIAANYRRIGWQEAIGASGTIRAALKIAQEIGVAELALTPNAVEAIIERILAARKLEKLSLPGLSPERAPVFAGGVAILAAIMQSLEIEGLTVSDGALREGLIYEMIGSLRQDDARIRTVQAFEGRFHVDKLQADQVEQTALKLFDDASVSWAFEDAHYRELLQWAARLHEIGLDISHSHYHHHSGYLLENANLPGFVRLEQQILATLVRHHRRKFEQFDLQKLPAHRHIAITRLVVLLRLAVLLNRTRSPVETPAIKLRPRSNSLKLLFPAGWLAENPLSAAGLEEERDWLKQINIRLSFESE